MTPSRPAKPPQPRQLEKAKKALEDSDTARERQLSEAIAAARAVLEVAEREVAAHPNEETRAAAARAKRAYQGRVWDLALLGEDEAHRMSRRFSRIGESSGPDLLSVAWEGLFIAAERFDPDRSVRFVFFARWWVRCEVSRWMYRDRRIRIPEGLNELAIHAKKLPSGLSDSELSVELGVSEGKVKALRKWVLGEPYVFIDETAPDSSETIGDRLIGGEDHPDDAWDELIEDQNRLVFVEPILDNLSPRLRFVLDRFLGLDGPPQSFVDIGKELGLSRERARQLFNDAIADIQFQSPASMRRLP